MGWCIKRLCLVSDEQKTANKETLSLFRSEHPLQERGVKGLSYFTLFCRSRISLSGAKYRCNAGG